ncbi:tRNA(Met) cytidine acetyltransferase TmcA [Durusdinium trenchii]|uniref:tRNA(Met) cytidine acetyltransferase TmcA n=1 Tax=Durusdinium trenchii TaxID=1381693 RepID=A0ABP0NYK7_9DINO
MTYLNGQFTKWHPSSPDQPTAPTSPTNPEQRKMKAEAEFDALSAEEKCEIVEEIADELGLWRLPRADAKANYGRSATMAFLKPSVVGSAVLVCHLRLFAEATSTQLSKLQGTHGSLEFPSSLSEIQRVVIHVLAASKGLTTLSEGSGADRRLVAYDTGDFALDMRTFGGLADKRGDMAPRDRRWERR